MGGGVPGVSWAHADNTSWARVHAERGASPAMQPCIAEVYAFVSWILVSEHYYRSADSYRQIRQSRRHHAAPARQQWRNRSYGLPKRQPIRRQTP